MPFYKRLLIMLGVGAGAFLVTFALTRTAFFEAVEASSHDMRVRALHDQAPPAEAVLVLVDEASLAYFKKEFDVRWPFSRGAYCPVLRFLKASGAKAVAFDIQFSEPDPMGDEEFAQCVAEAGFVVLGYQCHARTRGPPAPHGVQVAEGAAHVTSEPCAPLLPVAPLTKAAAGFAAIDPTPDPDGVLRRVRPLEAGKAGFHGTLGVGLWLAANPGAKIRHEGDAIFLGERRVPVDQEGEMLVRWRAVESPFPRYSFSTVFANGVLLEEGSKPEMAMDTFKDRAVFLGTSAAATYEFRVTPFREADYGIHVHASVYESIVSGYVGARAPPWLDTLLLFLLVFGVAGTAVLMPTIGRQAILSGLVFGIYIAVASWLFQEEGLWLDVVAPSVGMFLAFSGANVANYFTEGKSKAQIRSAFQHYLAPEVIAELVEDPSKLALGGERLEITAFFSDIADFTTFSEQLEPTALVAFLNEYLTALTNIILEEGGTIDKYEGDAIIAMFGAPMEHADHAVRAVRSAIRCQNKLQELRPGWQARGLPEVKTRIGLNSGLAVVGNMGSVQRFDYTMIGDTVNLAARLEGTNKVYDTVMMIGQGTERLCRDVIVMRELDRVRVKGKTEPIAVFEPLGLVGETAATAVARKSVYEGALAAYRRQEFADARQLLETLIAEHGDDPPSRVLLERISWFEKEAPAPEWDGVFEMLTK